MRKTPWTTQRSPSWTGLRTAPYSDPRCPIAIVRDGPMVGKFHRKSGCKSPFSTTTYRSTLAAANYIFGRQFCTSLPSCGHVRYTIRSIVSAFDRGLLRIPSRNAEKNICNPDHQKRQPRMTKRQGKTGKMQWSEVDFCPHADGPRQTILIRRQTARLQSTRAGRQWHFEPDYLHGPFPAGACQQ